MKRDTEFRSIIGAEIPRHTLSPKARERVEETYRILGAQREASKSRRPRRAIIASLSAVAACFALLIGTNAAFPAFAEELPLIGGIFAQFNGKTGKDLPPSVTQKVIEKAVKVEPTTEPGVAANSPLKIELTEASCDGMSLNLAFAITCSNAEWNDKYTMIYESYASEELFQITANGVELGSSFCYHPVFKPSETPGVYTGIVACTLPKKLREAETLDVQCYVPCLRVDTAPDQASMEEYPGDVETAYPKTDWESSFSLPVTPTFRTYTPNAEFGGVILERVVLGDASLECTFTLPEDWNNRTILNPLDDRGEVVSPYNRQTGGDRIGGGTKTITIFLTAPEYDTSTLTFQTIKYLDEYLGKRDDEIDPEITGTYTLELD